MKVVYPAGKEAFLSGTVAMMADTIKVALVGGYTYDAADTVIADVTGVIGTAEIVTVNSVDGGVALVGDVTFPSVSGATHVTGVVTYHDNTGTLICFTDQRADTVPLDVTPNGNDITFTFDHLVKL